MNLSTALIGVTQTMRTPVSQGVARHDLLEVRIEQIAASEELKTPRTSPPWPTATPSWSSTGSSVSSERSTVGGETSVHILERGGRR